MQPRVESDAVSQKLIDRSSMPGGEKKQKH